MFFMCVFLPVVFILHCVLPGIRMKNALLLLASVFFYAYGEPVYIILLFISTLLNYFCARLIEGSRFFVTDTPASGGYWRSHSPEASGSVC